MQVQVPPEARVGAGSLRTEVIHCEQPKVVA